jgi:hypothetical protein
MTTLSLDGKVALITLVDERTRRHLNICLDNVKQDALLAAELQLVHQRGLNVREST